MFNKMIMRARPTRDPEIIYSGEGEAGKCVAKMDLACNRTFQREGEPDADYFQSVAFGKNAKFIEKYVKKGTTLLITGRLQNNNYVKDGKKVYGNQIVIESIEPTEKVSSSENQGHNTSGDEGFRNIPDSMAEDLPFNHTDESADTSQGDA